MSLVKVRGTKVIFINPGGCAKRAANAINDEIRDELPFCVRRLKARAKNGFLQIGKNARPNMPHRWHACFERKELEVEGLVI